MALIFWLGTERASSERTFSLLDRILGWWPALRPVLSAEAVELLNAAVRKAGHFGGYALLGLLNGRAARLLAGGLCWRRTGVAWAAATAWAAVDEWHQSLSPSRGASAWDVALDAAGAAAGALIYLRWSGRWTA